MLFYFVVSPFHPECVEVEGLTFRFKNQRASKEVTLDIGMAGSGGSEAGRTTVFDLDGKKTHEFSTRDGLVRVELQSLGEVSGVRWFNFDLQKSAAGAMQAA